MSEMERFYVASRLSIGERVCDGSRYGSIVRRAARYWVDANSKPPMVRWDGMVDAVEVPWQLLIMQRDCKCAANWEGPEHARGCPRARP